MVRQYGHLIEKDNAIFPQGTNVEFVRVDARDDLTMLVWERGAGETLACGTGACATLVAAVLDGRSEKKATVRLLGGDLIVEWRGRGLPVFMTGPSRSVFEIVPESIDSMLI
jgi:diaminopimelate epimerase